MLDRAVGPARRQVTPPSSVVRRVPPAPATVALPFSEVDTAANQSRAPVVSARQDRPLSVVRRATPFSPTANPAPSASSDTPYRRSSPPVRTSFQVAPPSALLTMACIVRWSQASPPTATTVPLAEQATDRKSRRVPPGTRDHDA